MAVTNVPRNAVEDIVLPEAMNDVVPSVPPVPDEPLRAIAPLPWALVRVLFTSAIDEHCDSVGWAVPCANTKNALVSAAELLSITSCRALLSTLNESQLKNWCRGLASAGVL